MRRNSDQGHTIAWISQARLAGVVVLLVGVFSLAGAIYPDLLDYQRDAMRDGYEWWRLLTAHFVHVNGAHAIMNILAILLVLLIVGDAWSILRWLALYCVIAICISLAMLATLPDLSRYAGASGVIHGLLVAGALARLSRHRIESTVLLAGVAVKLGYEAGFGASAASEKLIGAAVITEAHLYGAFAGAILGIGALVWRRAFAVADDL